MLNTYLIASHLLFASQQWPTSASFQQVPDTFLKIFCQAATMSGSNATKLQAAMDIVVRDKNQALDLLDKVRGMAYLIVTLTFSLLAIP